MDTKHLQQRGVDLLDAYKKSEPIIGTTGELRKPDFMAKESTFRRIGREVGELVEEKNKAYGDSFAKTDKFLELLYPGGIKPSQYGDALALVRIFDKMMRIASKKNAFGESPYKDIVGYGILGVAISEKTRNNDPGHIVGCECQICLPR